jgi:hypothetical protein
MRHVEFEEEEEPTDEKEQLRRALVSGIGPALQKLVMAANQKYRFTTDDERWACIALSRLASLVFAQTESIPLLRNLAHPDHSPEEVLRLLDVCEGKCPSD